MPSASMVWSRDEYARTAAVILRLTEAQRLCERFPGFRRRFDRVRPMVDQANRWQVELLREHAQGRRRTRR